MSIRQWNETRSRGFASNIDEVSEDPKTIDEDYSWSSVHVSKLDYDEGRQGLEMTGLLNCRRRQRVVDLVDSWLRRETDGSNQSTIVRRATKRFPLAYPNLRRGDA